MEKNMRVCPSCGKKYSERPALSRKDNETLICADCGMKEAFAEYMQAMIPTDQIIIERGDKA